MVLWCSVEGEGFVEFLRRGELNDCMRWLLGINKQCTWEAMILISKRV
jgi:hypothetical protein